MRAVQSVFGFDGVSLFVLEGGKLKMAASVGEPLRRDLHTLDPHSGLSTSIRSSLGSLWTSHGGFICFRSAHRSSPTDVPISESDQPSRDLCERCRPRPGAGPTSRASLRSICLKKSTGCVTLSWGQCHTIFARLSQPSRSPLQHSRIARTCSARRHARIIRIDRDRSRSIDPAGHEPARYDPYRGRGPHDPTSTSRRSARWSKRRSTS